MRRPLLPGKGKLVRSAAADWDLAPETLLNASIERFLSISGSRRAVEPVRAVLFYQLIVDTQEQKGRGPLPNERRIMMFVGRFKQKRSQDGTDGSPQEKI